MVRTKKIMIALGAFLSFVICSAQVHAVELSANFRLFGEVERFGIGYGDMAINFGVNAPATTIGGLGFIPGGTPYTYGVLSPLTLSRYGFNVVDISFSVPFTMDVNKPASFYLGLGDNGIGGPAGGSVQVAFDFSDNVVYAGSLLGNTLDQGLSLTSVTLADGSPLSSAGLSFGFVPEHTVLTAFASAFDDAGTGVITSVATPLQNRAAVFTFPGTATAKLEGGFNRGGIPTEYLVNLDVSPEADPFVYDLAGAVVSGGDNVILTGETTNAPVPEPSSVLLVVIGIIGAAAWKRRPTTR